MSHDRYASGRLTGALTDRFGFPQLLAATIVLTAATILLGVAAKATGSGLACDANWPLCDGGLLNLFPANFPSFFEWIHRVVAMVAGFFIVGTAVAAWRGAADSRLVTWAVTLGLVLTPVQVYLGRETVLGYAIPVLTLHFWTAIAIFVLLVGAAILVSRDRLTSGHVTAALAAGAVTVPFHVALSPVFVQAYTPVVQTMQYAVTLVLVFVVCLAAIVGRRQYESRYLSAFVAGVVPAVALIGIVLGREATTTVGLDGPYLVVSALLFAAFVAGAWLTGQREPVSGRTA